MAKRKPREQSLFDNLEPAEASSGRDAAIRSALLGIGGNGPSGTSNVALH